MWIMKNQVPCIYLLFIMQLSGTVYADVEPLQRKIKPPPEDNKVQYQTVFPQPVIADPTPPALPPKSTHLVCLPCTIKLE